MKTIAAHTIVSMLWVFGFLIVLAAPEIELPEPIPYVTGIFGAFLFLFAAIAHLIFSGRRPY